MLSYHSSCILSLSDLSLEGFLVHCISPIKMPIISHYVTLWHFFIYQNWHFTGTRISHIWSQDYAFLLQLNNSVSLFLFTKKNASFCPTRISCWLWWDGGKMFLMLLQQQFSHPLRRIEQECWLLLNNQLQRDNKIKAKSEVLMASVCTCL